LRDFSTKIPLIGVGPARTASTWTHQIFVDTKLVERPSTKELSYFNKNYEKQLAWYRREFTDNGLDYWIEVTPQYIESLLYCTRIYDTFPNAYILMGIRDPIDRIKSIFKLYYYNTKSKFKGDYEKYLQEILTTQILISSRVAFLYSMYGDRFVVIRYEDLKSDPIAVANEVLSRCGIDAPPPLASNYVLNSLYTPKHPTLTSIGQSLFRRARERVPPAVAWSAKTMGERLLTQKIQLEEFLGEEEFERLLKPYLATIERDKRKVEEIVGPMSPALAGFTAPEGSVA
jgi:Sulfotransferase family